MGGLNLKFSGISETAEPVSIDLPRSKSISNRLLILQSLSGGAVDVSFLSDADDTRLLHAALQSESRTLWLGHAGTALRFGLAWAAVTPGLRVLKGSPRLHERPIAPLVDALRVLGADIQYLEKEGYAPLQVRGKKLCSRPLMVDATYSSQFISALMLIGPLISGGLDMIISGDKVSAPYIDMTAQLMREAGADLDIDLEAGSIRIGQGVYSATHFDVECDWSAASYLYALLALTGKGSTVLPGLCKSGLQGDERAAQIFAHFGVRTDSIARGLRITARGIADTPLVLDFVDCPDLAQTVAVVAAGLRHSVKLTGLQTLRHKETDRIAALKTELWKCGVLCKSGDSYIELVSFKDPEGVPTIETYDDHRMAMAFAPLAVVFGEINIAHPEVVSKSFPGFWNELGKMGIAQMVF